eukprot:1160441-Pelagomonas_calceolata.AAC.2
MGIRRVTSSSYCYSPCLRVGRSLLKSASGANKFISILDRMSVMLAHEMLNVLMKSVMKCLTSRVANIHATKDGCTGAVGWSCECTGLALLHCTGLALLHVAAKLLLISLNGAGLAAACRECLGQTQRPDQLHQVRVASGTRHPWQKAREQKQRQTSMEGGTEVEAGNTSRQVSEGSYGSNLVQLDAGNADRLAQHDLHVPKQVSNRALPSYLFKPRTPTQVRCNSSRPGAILVTPCPANPSRLPPPSHRELRSMRATGS